MISDTRYHGATLYFHSPCFDGIVSGLLAWEFLEQSCGWTFDRLVPVNYDRKATWLNEELSAPAAVVDYLYHPGAAFWADHHQSTFLTSQAEQNFKKRTNPFLLYDRHAESCSTLLWKRFASFFSDRKPNHADLVAWAARIDSARYSSVEEAIFGNHPALQINNSLAVSEPDYPEKLVRLLREYSMGEVAAMPEVQGKLAKSRSMILAGLERFSQSACFAREQVVLFDVESEGVLVSRYAPFYEPRFRNARYSLGITRGERVVITAMRNPWREFQSAPLGKIFAGIGGGGHERVGAYIVPKERAEEAEKILDQILDAIRKYERVGDFEISSKEVASRV